MRRMQMWDSFFMKLATPMLLQLTATMGNGHGHEDGYRLGDGNGDGCKLINLALNAHTHVYAS